MTVHSISDSLKVHLSSKVKKILENGKGILAADEKATSLESKFIKNGIANTEDNRRILRECLFKTKMDKYIGGAILNEETFSQTDDKGILLVDYLQNQNIEIGVKMDKGLVDFNSLEKISVGLEDLETRLKDVKFEKATFCKWRSLFTIQMTETESNCCKNSCCTTGCIGCCCKNSCCKTACKNSCCTTACKTACFIGETVDPTTIKGFTATMNPNTDKLLDKLMADKVDLKIPSDDCINRNCIILCKYALAVQKSGRVPIIEPEISIDGNYTIEEMRMTAKRIYSRLFQIANEMDLFLPGVILKCSFLSKNSINFDMDEIGWINVETLAESVPLALGAVVFLSGGHSSKESFDLLKRVHRCNPYKDLLISFSFCRALTNCVLESDLFEKRGDENAFSEAQKRFSKVLEECFNSNR